MGTPQFGEHQAFWNRAARDDLLIAIMDNEGTRDRARAQEAFDEQGAIDARDMLGMTHPDATIVDLGCGIGRVLRPLAAHCKTAIGVDVSDEMIERGRSYAAGVENLKFVQTDGRTLPGIADDSVDLLYSLFVLIHVDRRSAFHYFRETRRVLRPSGVAHLLFHNIQTDAGLAKFEEFVGTDYPLEFYTDVELKRLLLATGLDLLSCEAGGMYWRVNVVADSASTFRQRLHTELRVIGDGSSGSLASGTQFDPNANGRRWIRIETPRDSCWSLEVVAALSARDRGIVHAAARTDAVVPLTPGTQTEIGLEWDATAQHFSITSSAGSPIGVRSLPPLEPSNRPWEATGKATLHLGLVPPGHAWSEETMREFPSFFELRDVCIAGADSL